MVERDALPACCPPRDACLWNSHPRVYLPLAEEPESAREACCPYCSTRYVLAVPERAR